MNSVELFPLMELSGDARGVQLKWRLYAPAVDTASTERAVLPMGALADLRPA